MEGYTTEEIVECCTDYINDSTSIGLPISRHEGRLSGKGTKGRKSFTDRDYQRIDKAHFSVLQQSEIVGPYFEKHLREISDNNKGCSAEWIIREHKRTFTSWLMNLDLPNGDTMEEKMLKRIACRPRRNVVTFQAYDINGFTFYTQQKDKKSKCQNSGVRVQAIDEDDKLSSYYGYIEEIWELDYGEHLQIPVFRCKWVKHPDGVLVDEYGITIVDLNNLGHRDEPWILAKTVQQVFYVLDPKDEKKHIVVPGKQKIVGVENVEDQDEYNQYDEVPFFMEPKNFEVLQARLSYSAGMPYMRTDCEGKVVQG